MLALVAACSATGGAAAQNGPFADLAHARALLERNRLPEAERLLAMLVRDVPDSATVWYELALCRRLLGKEREALAAAEEALARQKAFPEALLLSAELLFRDQRQKSRERALELAKLVQNDRIGERTDFVRRTASLLLDLGEVARAAKLIDKARTMAPRDKELLHLSAKLALTLSETEKAIAALRELLQLDPHDPHAAESLARVLVAVDRRGEAITTLRTSLGTHPSNVHARTLLIQLLQQTGADPESIAQQQAYLRHYKALRARAVGTAPGTNAPGAAADRRGERGDAASVPPAGARAGPR